MSHDKDIPGLSLLKKRHSVRAFTDGPISAEHLKKLRAELTMTNTHQQGFRFQLIADDPDPMAGFSRSYGIFTNPRNYMAAVVDVATPDALERAGYFAEQFVIKCVSLGIGTCYVGGTYDEHKVKAQIRAGEKILFLVLLGYPLGKVKTLAKIMAKAVHIRSMNINQFFEPSGGLESAYSEFPMLNVGLEAVACAPSSLNKRPTRIFIGKSDNGQRVLCARVDEGNPKNLIDLGIAKFNYNFATGTECGWGNGSPLDNGICHSD